MLIGINGDTPLGQTINIRAEKDSNKLREMTAHEKEIRKKWSEFKQGQKEKIDEKQSLDEINKMLKAMFGR